MTRRKELERLLADVDVLANRIRTIELFEQGDGASGGARGVMKILEQHGAQTVPQIGRLRETSRQNIQVLVNRLEAEGCVELMTNPAHKKSELVRLTERGRALLADAVAEESHFLSNLARQIGEAEVIAARSVIARIRELLAQGTEPIATEAVKRTRKAPSAAVESQPDIGSGEEGEDQRHSPQPASEIPDKSESEPELAEGELPYNLL